MPPKSKFTRQEIIHASLDIARTQGLSAVTARSLAKKLGTSSKPIFGIFSGMDELQEEVVKAAKELYSEYIARGLKEEPAFKGVGMNYILFAIEEPKLFQLLFMSESEELPDIHHVLPCIDDNYDKILASITQGYEFDEKSAKKLYKHLWIYSHGIASLCATKMCHFTGEEISEMMTDVGSGLIRKIKEESIHAGSDGSK